MDLKFYILIIIAWFIFNIVRFVRKANAAKEKNKPNTPTVTSPRNRNARSLEELFAPTVNTQTRNTGSPQAVPAYGSQEVIIDETMQDSEEAYNRGSYSAYTSQENITSEEQHYTFDNEEQDEKDDESHNAITAIRNDERVEEFDLKQALIYSEILRRPYS